MNMSIAKAYTTHPSAEMIAGLAADPGAARYAETAHHLADCASCRDELQRARRLIQGLRKVSISAPTGFDHLSSDEIARYASEPSAPQHQQWQAHLDQCDQCMRDLLLYRTRILAAGSRDRPNKGGEALSSARSVQSAWWSRRIPVWSAVPVSVAAALVVTLGLTLFLPAIAPQPAVTSYQDDAQIYFSAVPFSGLGFFSDASSTAEPFAGISVSVDDDHLVVSWPPVGRTKSYTLELIYFDAHEPMLLRKLESTVPSASLERMLVKPGKRYEWVLSGVDQDNRFFTAQGGFVLAK